MENLPVSMDRNIPPIRYGVTTPRPHKDLLPIPPSCADRNRRFVPYPSNSKPCDLFTLAPSLDGNLGFIGRTDRRQMLMFCDGACGDNGGYDPRGGCGVVFQPGGFKFPLEENGIRHTSNRAELSAVIYGLQCRDWVQAGFENIVIACDSEYIVLGFTSRLDKWIDNGWETTAGMPVANQDLWKKLLEILRNLERESCQVQFWQIPREWNEADKYAKAAVPTAHAYTAYVGGCWVVSY